MPLIRIVVAFFVAFLIALPTPLFVPSSPALADELPKSKIGLLRDRSASKLAGKTYRQLVKFCRQNRQSCLYLATLSLSLASRDERQQSPWTLLNRAVDDIRRLFWMMTKNMHGLMLKDWISNLGDYNPREGDSWVTEAKDKAIAPS